LRCRSTEDEDVSAEPLDATLPDCTADGVGDAVGRCRCIGDADTSELCTWLVDQPQQLTAAARFGVGVAEVGLVGPLCVALSVDSIPSHGAV
jgi:hypothetical protein